MARNKAERGAKKRWTKAKWKGFVSTRLTSQEREEIKKLLLGADGISQFFRDAATAGYKVSLSYSIPEDVFTVSLTGAYQEKPNAGLTVSLRHKDFETAVTAMWWCVKEDGYGIDWEERFGDLETDNW